MTESNGQPHTSAGQNPATGNVCQGVWRRVGKSTYSLNHVANAYVDPENRVRIHFHGLVTVDQTGDNYSGEYTADIHFVTTSNPFDESNPIASGGGNMWGHRVKPD